MAKKNKNKNKNVAKQNVGNVNKGTSNVNEVQEEVKHDGVETQQNPTPAELKTTLVISAFPGTGKTHAFENLENLNILDSDSSKYSWITDDDGKNTTERNPNFPQNYIDHIKGNIGIADVIMVSSHKEIRSALVENKIYFSLVYPQMELKQEYLERFDTRGDSVDFIELINKNWDNFVTDCAEQSDCHLLEIGTGVYLSNLIKTGDPLQVMLETSTKVEEENVEPPKTEQNPDFVDHVVTEEDVIANPDEGLKVGETIQIPVEVAEAATSKVIKKLELYSLDLNPKEGPVEYLKNIMKEEEKDVKEELGATLPSKPKSTKPSVCIYHSRDLDGWMSAAIVKKWHSEQENVQPIEFIGWDYGDAIPDFSQYGDVFIADVCLPPEEMLKIEMSGVGFIWCDHHISAIKDIETKFERNDVQTPAGMRDEKFAACELTWKEFFPQEEMPEIVRLLGRYDCFGHKGTDEEQLVLEFQYGARASITNMDDCFEALEDTIDNPVGLQFIATDGKAIYSYLMTEAKQTYAKAFPIKFNNDQQAKSGSEGYVPEHLNFLMVNQERFNPINFGIDYHDEGYDGFGCFWYKDGKWTFSLYNDNEKVNCSVICKRYGGGGHFSASGFVTDSAIMRMIINNK